MVRKKYEFNAKVLKEGGISWKMIEKDDISSLFDSFIHLKNLPLKTSSTTGHWEYKHQQNILRQKL